MGRTSHSTERLPKAVAIVGPTASGKTKLAIRLAKRFNGEIVSADSRQVYRGMRIGADVPEGERRTVVGRRIYMVEGVPHHLMAFRSPARPMTAAEYRRMALRAMRDIVRRGKVPFLVGGTGLYVTAVIDGLATSVPPDRDLRARLERLSTSRLAAMLRRRDPAYAARISMNNRRYVIRAIEAYEGTGRPFSELQKEKEPSEFDLLELGITRPREELYRRIDARVDDMVAEGLVSEAARLAKRYGWDLSSMSGLGYRQLRGYLEGRETMAEGVEKVKRDTRRYAKRQLTWFGRDKRIQWITSPGQAERKVRAFLAKK